MVGDERWPIIRVVGVGGAGCNAVDRMMQVGVAGVGFVAANTDSQALACSGAPCKIQLGPSVTRGLGAGGDPKVGVKAAEESRRQVGQALEGAEMVFIAAGMGGGTGTGGAPVVAEVARSEIGALTIAVVTTPFSFEGQRRAAAAREGLERLHEAADSVIVVPNDRLLEVVDRRVSLDVAFRIADDVLRQGIQGISELVTRPGLINLDFADVRAVMTEGKGALMSMGQGVGEDKAALAARAAINCPLLGPRSIQGARGILVSVTGGPDMTLKEAQQAVEAIMGAVRRDANLRFGVTVDDSMEDRLQVILVAVGMDSVEEQVQPESKENKQEHSSLRKRFAGGEDAEIPAFLKGRIATE